jgi:hypothetical protein
MGVITISITFDVSTLSSSEAFGAPSFSYNLPNRVTVKTGSDVGFRLNKRPSLDT